MRKYFYVLSTLVIFIIYMMQMQSVDAQQNPANKSRITKSLFLKTSCPPGGQPDITLKKNNTVTWSAMKVYGMPMEGFITKRGTYAIDMSSHKIRSWQVSLADGQNTGKIIRCWSAPISVRYYNGKRTSGYVVDCGKKRLWQYNLCGNNTGEVVPPRKP
jgi:hypothetical protein